MRSAANAPRLRSHVTLALCTLLHVCTHAYGTFLVPLYLLIAADLKLGGVSGASLIVTLYGAFYCLGSFPAGVWADRFDRKVLLGIGLLGNAAAVTLMGLTRSYETMLVLGVLGGLCGSLFHPAAYALGPAHYPKSPGTALGLLSIGSGLGFFVGPQFAGWRAQHATWHFAHIAAWQRPCVELGLAGFCIGIIFLLIAREVHNKTSRAGHEHPPLGKALAHRVLRLASVIGCRSFSGIATLSLCAIYLQKAQHLSVETTGAILGILMLPNVLINPLLVWLCPGRRRLPALAIVLIGGGLSAPVIPFLSWKAGVLLMGVFQTFHMGSYALSDASMLERVPNAVRGRVVGVFLTVAGTMGAMGPWAMGWWTDLLGKRGGDQIAYAGVFATMGVLMFLALFGLPLLTRLGPPHMPAIEPFSEMSPETMGVVG